MPTSLCVHFQKLEPLTPGTCEWCGRDVDPPNAFCSISCEAQNRRLESAQGLLIIRALKRWRMAPNHAARNEALSFTTPLLDKMLRNDRLRREKAGIDRRAAAQAEAAKNAPDAASVAPETQEES